MTMKGELTGKHILLMLIAFFGVIFAVNTDLIIKAETTFSGEDDHNPYLQGIDYNKTLARRAQQANLGWQASIAAARDNAKAIQVRVVVMQQDGIAPSGLALQGRLRHPSDAKFDRTLTFRNEGGGRFLATLSNVPAGIWNVEVKSTVSPDGPFEADKRVWLP